MTCQGSERRHCATMSEPSCSIRLERMMPGPGQLGHAELVTWRCQVEDTCSSLAEGHWRILFIRDA